MFYDFNAHRKKAGSSALASDKSAKKIFARIILIQRKWAEFMHRHAKKLSDRQTKAIFYSVTLTAILISAYLLCNGLFDLSHSDLSEPLHKAKSSALDLGKPQSVPDGLGQYLDSLENALIKDSINQSQLNKRP